MLEERSECKCWHSESVAYWVNHRPGGGVAHQGEAGRERMAVWCLSEGKTLNIF